MQAPKITLINISFEFDNCVRGHHIYKDVWTPVVNDGLNYRREEENVSDPYTVAIIKSGNIVGHTPCWMSTACSLFIQKGSAVAFPIAALSSSVHQLYFPQLAVVAVNTFPTYTFAASSSALDNKGTLVGSTTDKLEEKLGLFFVWYKKYFSNDISFLIRFQFTDFNFTVVSLTVKL